MITHHCLHEAGVDMLMSVAAANARASSPSATAQATILHVMHEALQQFVAL